MHYVYVLRSGKDGNLYVGCTKDVTRRYAQHLKGLVRATKGRLPVELIYEEAYSDIYEAFRMERFYKTSRGKKILKEKL